MNPVVASALVGLLGAWFAGLHITSPYLYEVIIHGGIVFLASLLVLVFTVMRIQALRLLTLLALPVAMWYSQGIITCEIRPTTEWRTDSQPQVSLRTWTDQHGNLIGEITNNHPRDWMYVAEVQCRMVWANGKPSDVVRTIGMGAAGSWLHHGDSIQQRLVSSNGNLVSPGMDVSLTQCAVANAQMYKDPAVKPQFTTRVDSRTRQWLFDVHNTQARNLTSVKFSCWAHRMNRRHKLDLIGRPFYSDDRNYIVKPGESVVLYVDQSADVFDLEGCEIKDVNWL